MAREVGRRLRDPSSEDVAEVGGSLLSLVAQDTTYRHRKMSLYRQELIGSLESVREEVPEEDEIDPLIERVESAETDEEIQSELRNVPTEVLEFVADLDQETRSVCRQTIYDFLSVRATAETEVTPYRGARLLAGEEP